MVKAPQGIAPDGGDHEADSLEEGFADIVARVNHFAQGTASDRSLNNLLMAAQGKVLRPLVGPRLLQRYPSAPPADPHVFGGLALTVFNRLAGEL